MHLVSSGSRGAPNPPLPSSQASLVDAKKLRSPLARQAKSLTHPDQPLPKGLRLGTRVVPKKFQDPREIPVRGYGAALPFYDTVLVHSPSLGQFDLPKPQLQAPLSDVLAQGLGRRCLDAVLA